MLDNLLINKIQIGGIAGLDLLPDTGISNSARNYLISCKVEGKSPRTIETYSMVLRDFLKSSQSGAQAPNFSANQIRMWLLSLQERGLSPSTVHIYYRSLKTFFNWLVKEDLIPKSPMENIRPPRVPRVIIKPFSSEDIDNLLSLCSGDRFLPTRNRAIILLFIDTGLRLSELAGIQLIDIDFDRETIKVLGKGAKERIVRMGKTTQKALLRYLLMRRDNHDCLWVTEERRPMKKAGIQTVVKRLCKRADVTDAKPGTHTFRHTAAIQCLRNGMGEFTLQLMLGHSTLAMTRRYVSTLGEEDLLRAHRMASPVDRMKLK